MGEMKNLKCSQRILRTALCAWISLLSTWVVEVMTFYSCFLSLILTKNLTSDVWGSSKASLRES